MPRQQKSDLGSDASNWLQFIETIDSQLNDAILLKKVIVCELHLRYGLFSEDSVDYGAPSPALWGYEMFSKVSHPRWSIKQASTFWKRTIFWTSTLNYGTVFIKKKTFIYSYICDLEHFQMISLRTVVLGWWDKLMWWFLWYSTYNEQWNGRSIYQEEWITWYRFKSYETFHNYFASKTNWLIFPQNSFRWGSGRPKFFTKAIVCANRLGNSLYSFSNQFQGPWQIL